MTPSETLAFGFDHQQSIYTELPHYCSNEVKNTRYTPWNFIFKNLYEQFHAFWNFYFLLLACLQLWREISPVNPILTWAPLIMVLGFTAAKDAYEDHRRALADRLANSRPVTRISPPPAPPAAAPAAAVAVGDLILIRAGEPAPADLVILTCDNDSGSVQVCTASLDGEAAPKPRRALLPGRPRHAAARAGALRGRGAREPPSADLHTLSAEIVVDDEVHLAGVVNTVLCGAVLVAGEVVGLVVYTGGETRIAQSRTPPRTKVTEMDVRTNRMVMLIFAMQWLFVLIMSLCGLSTASTPWYLVAQHAPWAVIPLRFFLLSSMCIPISFRVTVDAVRILTALRVQRDPALAPPPAPGLLVAAPEDASALDDASVFDTPRGRDTPRGTALSLRLMPGQPAPPAPATAAAAAAAAAPACVVRNSAALEDAGRLAWLCCDKTGTLSQNNLQLRSILCLSSIHPIHPIHGPAPSLAAAAQSLADALDAPAPAPALAALIEAGGAPGALLTLLLCHSCETLGGRPTGASTDEVAALAAVAEVGARVVVRHQHGIVLSVCGVEASFAVLRTGEFTSARRFMSVVVLWAGRGRASPTTLADIVRAAPAAAHTGLVLAKGAPEVVLARSAPQPACLASNMCSCEQGTLRLLGLCHRTLTGPELITTALAPPSECPWEEGLFQHSGALALEDSLQPGVPEAIHALRAAGIRPAVLTGDARGAAQRVAAAAGVTDRGATIVAVDTLADLPQPASIRPGTALLIAGSVLAEAAREIAAHDLSLYGPTPTGTLRSLAHRLRKTCLCFSDSLRQLRRARALRASPRALMDLHGGLAPAADPLAGPLAGTLAAGARTLAPPVRQLLRCICLSSGVVAYRLAPGDKALVVQLLQSLPGRPRVGAIGDGANDVPQILAADFGIGIEGREGLTASRAADVGVSSFAACVPLLLHHGRSAAWRTAWVVQYSVYKSLIIGVLQVWFNLFTGFSGQGIIDGLSLSMFNVVFTSVPPLAAAWNTDVSPRVAAECPGAYRDTRRFFTPVSALSWVLLAAWHAVAVLLVVPAAAAAAGCLGGRDLGLAGASQVAIFSIMLMQLVIQVFSTRSWNWFTLLSIVLSQAAFVAMMAVSSAGKGGFIAGTHATLWSSGAFWVLVLLVAGLAGLPLALGAGVRRVAAPRLAELGENECKKPLPVLI